MEINPDVIAYNQIYQDERVLPIPFFTAFLRQSRPGSSTMNAVANISEALVDPAAHMLFGCEQFQGYKLPLSHPQSRGFAYLALAQFGVRSEMPQPTVDGLYVRALGETRGATNAHQIPLQFKLETIVGRVTAVNYFSQPVLKSMIEEGVLNKADGFDLVFDYALNVGKIGEQEFIAALVNRATRGHPIGQSSIAPESAIENLIRVIHAVDRHAIPWDCASFGDVESLIRTAIFQKDTQGEVTAATAVHRQQLMDLLRYGDQESDLVFNLSRRNYAKGKPADQHIRGISDFPDFFS